MPDPSPTALEGWSTRCCGSTGRWRHDPGRPGCPRPSASLSSAWAGGSAPWRPLQAGGGAETRVVVGGRVVRLAAHQPQYMPWLGYFDKMARADRFVLLDTVQYKKNEWQNRNRIRTATGWQWITVPVRYRFPMRIGEVRVDSTSPWRRKQCEALRQSYARAPYRDALQPLLDELLERPIEDLATLNAESIRLLARLLEVRTPLVLASSMDGIPDGPDERLIALCRALGCDTYLA